MYSASLKTKDRSSAIAAALAIQAALLAAFLSIAGVPDTTDAQVPLRLVDVSIPLPRQPVRPHKVTKARQQSGSAPEKLESRATAIVSPTPKIATVPVKIIAARPSSWQGLDAADGSSPLRGAGSGSGGTGSGEGGGSGSGAGGDPVQPPRLASAVLSAYDFPRQIIDQWPRAATVFLRLRIDGRGYVSECLLDRGTNVPMIDSEMCNTAHERLRFRPAVNRSGQAVAGWFGYAQPAPR